jgi:hypothetical protein
VSLADIDAAATRQRIQDIADNAKKAFAAHAQASAEIDAASREAMAKEEADARAVQERLAEIESRKAAAEAATLREQQEQKPKKPATLSLGAEEFKLDRQARKAGEQAVPAPPAQQDEPAGEDEPARKDQTARKDEPARRRTPRPAPPEGDDDMSGRTWLR